ncbi:MAG TPA: hypothetical protein VGZ32_22630 [Actinocrinis sp.]|uniref:hypothetical protein n=1 Tax=Actinocrinis sp. TaxID=1920516 RepID=UPI002DDD2417|nr:hypothetical protein [Actinocrinis sp.]HEV3173161.1 hypothetical protein [Actinocrinis sp.]
MTAVQSPDELVTTQHQQPAQSRSRRRLPAGWWSRRSRLAAFLVLIALIAGLAAASWSTGFRAGFWPNFLLNSSGDLIGGLVVLFLIEPIVRQAAALQIVQHPRLDYGWFLRRAHAANREIRILDTFSSLFASDRDAAIRTLRDAAIRGVNIRVLLMSPNTGASALREFQLRQTMPGLWINDRIQENIADFRELAGAILAAGNGHRHGVLELRLYSVAAPFALYGWDDRALFAFLPPHNYSDQSTQLEMGKKSQLGREADDQFEAIWTDAAPVPQLLPIDVLDDRATRTLLVRFVDADGETYVISKRVDAALHANPALLIALDHGSGVFEPEPMTEGAVLAALETSYYAKYARRPDAAFHLLRPRSEDVTPVDRPQEHESLPSRILMEWIDGARRSIRLMDTSSTLMAEAGPAFARAIERALSRGVRVRVLLLAPTTRAALERAAEIQDPVFETRIEANIRELRRIARKMQADGVPGVLDARLYDRLPHCSVHEVDDRMMLGFLPYRRRTSRVKHLEIFGDTPLGQFADKQFEDQWRTARPLDGMQYADVRCGQETSRLLLRIWSAGGTRYLASNRIEGILERNRPAGDGPALLSLAVEDWPGEFHAADPLDPATDEGRTAAAAFEELFGTTPDAPVRRLDQGAVA